MRKAIVTVALILLLTGIVLAVSIQESHTEESILDKWDPIYPRELYPTNVTGWAFMELTSDGTFLELNITASDVVRVRIGIIVPVDEEATLENLTFNDTGTRFTQRIAIAETNATYLEIKNEGTNIVNISGDIKKIGNIRRTSYPYLGLGTLAAVSGLILLIYGVSAKPKKKRFKGKSRTSTL
jgi:hypothetical protein